MPYIRFQKYSALMIVSIFSVLSACSSTEEEKYVERPVEELYNTGLAELKERRFSKAANAFDEVERQHPYSQWATQAQLMSAYAHYQNQKYEKALAALDTFIQLHPAHPDISYAYYLQGLCYYEQLSPVERDQKMTELAMNSFQEILKRFPDSSYAKDVKLKLSLLQDMIAAKEMQVGRYYQTRKRYIAAMNRFSKVVKDFQTTAHVPEALHRLVEVYLALNLKEEALSTASILSHNFPTNNWYTETYLLMKGEDFREKNSEGSLSWFNKIWNDQS
ncbi:MAG: outer membrane protein assembly factor BamD [Caedibacter sp. 38-128]|nr:outer membrane protein assembly factor BamD [Holosporales bacterium]OJX08884.1 MAG: outer membrane protein assembly factor BamD [Caedibacter sp. 38-128]